MRPGVDEQRPAWPTSLVGRDPELNDIATRLLDSATRVLTITGPAGSGKTRLSLEIARRTAADFDDGTVFIPLADVDDARYLASEISRALGFVDAPRQHPIDRLVAGLRTQHLLLVLDNFEHLVDAASLVTEIVQRCKQVLVLVTSRRRLGIDIEHVVEIGGLALPGPGSAIGLTQADSAPAVQLFLQSAAAVNSEFTADAATTAAIAELCRLVDGLPLAIELLASYVRVMPVESIVERLLDGRTTLGLDQTIAWSYELLSPPAAALLPRLSVFHDGCTLEAVEAVCFHGEPTGEMLDALIELVDLHLVEPIDLGRGDVRFGLLETVRRFAGDRLGADDDLSGLLDWHAAHYRQVAARCGAGFESPGSVAAVSELQREMANVRAALERSERTGQWNDGLAAVLALCPYWSEHGPIDQAHAWVRRFAEHAHDAPLLRHQAAAWEVWYEFGETLEVPDLPDVDVAGTGWLTTLGEARRLLGEAGDRWAWARAGVHEVLISQHAGLFERVDALVPEIVDQPGDDIRWFQVEALLYLAQSLRERGLGDRARQVTERGMELARSERHERMLCRFAALYATFATEIPEARNELEPVYTIALDIGDRRGAAIASASAAMLAIVAGDHKGAATWLRRTLDIGVAISWPTAVARGVAGMAWVAALEHRPIEAARLYGAYEPHVARMRRGHPPQVAEMFWSAMAGSIEQLGDQYDIERRRGRDGGWDAAIDLARQLADELTGGGREARSRRRRGPRANPELTGRELDVLAELVAGHTNQQIGSSLGISPKTVMHHTMSVYRKLGVRGRAEAVAHALRTGLVTA